jgi:hypothetical protein
MRDLLWPRDLIWSEEGDADPPPGYVAFVAGHVSQLRRDVRQVMEDPELADRMYPEVLTDVALAWRRLEYARQRGHPEAAEAYMAQCVRRRLFDRPDDERYDADGRVEPAFEVRFVVWDAADSALPHLPPPEHQNAALRLAQHILPLVDPEPAPLAEAAIAWWHAYEVRRRRRRITAALAALAIVLFPLAAVGSAGAGY